MRKTESLDDIMPDEDDEEDCKKRQEQRSSGPQQRSNSFNYRVIGNLRLGKKLINHNLFSLGLVNSIRRGQVDGSIERTSVQWSYN
ncbi:unnamed protein product [Nezara viridula]|uniref:Uncharacterized protein n=1 Tax=Nezara viridula TaxID=85310 RepID=A0A9P0HBR4_NEZVI|nr:unnamed protein product [Nezara viridula]